LRYKEFNNIEIISEFGVSGISTTTLILARESKKVNFEFSIDIGTGTGFIPIYLSTCGKKCDGIDINPKSIDCAKKNGKLNNLKINFYLSDFFENVTEKYDLIIFNPPFGNTDSSFFMKYVEHFKSLIQNDNRFFLRFSYYLIKKQRIKLLERFFKTYKKCLKEKGIILIYLHPSEFYFLNGMKFIVIEEFVNQKLVKITT